MKKLVTILGAIVFISLFNVGCKEEKKEIDLKLKSTDFKGDLSDYFTVVEGTYKLSKGVKDWQGNDKYLVKVQIKRTDKKFDFNAVDLQQRGYLSIICDLFDEQGVPVKTADREGFRTQGVNSEDAALVTLKPSETGWAIFSYHGDNETMNKVKSLQVDSKANMNQAEKNSTSSKKSEDASVSNDIDCDKFIKDYEEFADSYIKLLKKYKANPTDASIMTEYTDAAQKAAEMQTGASSCTDAKYANKLIAIANKIAKAAL